MRQVLAFFPTEKPTGYCPCDELHRSGEAFIHGPDNLKCAYEKKNLMAYILRPLRVAQQRAVVELSAASTIQMRCFYCHILAGDIFRMCNMWFKMEGKMWLKWSISIHEQCSMNLHCCLFSTDGAIYVGGLNFHQFPNEACQFMALYLLHLTEVFPH